jgi:hypothetical protein
VEEGKPKVKTEEEKRDRRKEEGEKRVTVEGEM